MSGSYSSNNSFVPVKRFVDYYWFDWIPLKAGSPEWWKGVSL
jgi:hypothetical protein